MTRHGAAPFPFRIPRRLPLSAALTGLGHLLPSGPFFRAADLVCPLSANLLAHFSAF